MFSISSDLGANGFGRLQRKADRQRGCKPSVARATAGRSGASAGSVPIGGLKLGCAVFGAIAVGLGWLPTILRADRRRPVQADHTWRAIDA